MRTRPIRRFTGRHMTGILVAFFLVVIAVNLSMATIAVRSFGGVVVDNSYVESQKFNAYLEQARAQARQGWQDGIGLDARRHVVLTLRDAAGVAIGGAKAKGVAVHPLGRRADRALAFREVAPGRYASDGALPAGRWQLRLVASREGVDRRLLGEVR